MTLPRAFIWRRLHSLTGVFLVLFLMEHLLTNGQSALFIGDDGAGFIRAVNNIHNLPFLQVIELTLLGVPIVLHTVWGVQYALTSQPNAYGGGGITPHLPYRRNRAFTWQRLTAWVLMLGIVGHVVQMRFLDYPDAVREGASTFYKVPLQFDEGLPSLSERLGVVIEPGAQPGQVVAVAPDFGTAELLLVRETFKMPLMMALYTLFVLSAVYHGFNGLWTALISWGVTLTPPSQRWMRLACKGLMVLIGFLGLASIYGTYWINLRN